MNKHSPSVGAEQRRLPHPNKYHQCHCYCHYQNKDKASATMYHNSREERLNPVSLMPQSPRQRQHQPLGTLQNQPNKKQINKPRSKQIQRLSGEGYRTRRRDKSVGEFCMTKRKGKHWGEKKRGDEDRNQENGRKGRGAVATYPSFLWLVVNFSLLEF